MPLNSKNVIAKSNIAFGTSGARGLVVDFTRNTCAAYAHAFVAVLRNKYKFQKIGIAIDRRPSSESIAMYCAAALAQEGIEPIFYGVLPTPALAYTTMGLNIPAIMITGSHIPFDRNGLKFYRPDGEISKVDEIAITNASVNFDLPDSVVNLAVEKAAEEAYLDRYQSIIEANALLGKRIGIYEHSSAGRDLYRILFENLGAEVISLGRSDKFIPIDTEAVSKTDIEKAKDWSQRHQLDAIFSTDGDGDRPLLADENGDWLRGDILGLLCAKLLGIEALSVPVNSNSAIEQCGAFRSVCRTKIGSPYVIAEFEQLNNQYSSVAGFEANGGFLLAKDIVVNGSALLNLPTRDAVLPALIVLSKSSNSPISSLLSSLPTIFTASDRIENFPKEISEKIMSECLAGTDDFLISIGIKSGYTNIDQTDGIRITLKNKQVIHLRPSGNAPELRCYVESNSLERSRALVEYSISAIKQLTILE